MKSSRIILILCVTIVVLSALSLVYIRGQRNHTFEAKVTSGQAELYRDIFDENKIPQIYGKIKIPAELSFKLSPSEDSEAPVTLVMSALSTIPVSSGKVTLKIPQIGNEQAGSIELWSGTQSDYVFESLQYVGDTLPVGTYRFVLVFEFEPLGEETKSLAISKSLYLDVRPTEILSSNVSFQHIKRLELLKELEQRALLSLRPELKNADAKMAVAESIDPAIISKKIQEIRASDPDVARRMMELNRIEEQASDDYETAYFSEKLQMNAGVESNRASIPRRSFPPVIEVPAAIPERFRNQ